MTDQAFRTKISLYLSLGVSLVYVGINVWSWHLGRSWWFVVLAVYYAIMAFMRFLLVRYVRLNALGTSILKEWKWSRVCACVLLLVNLTLSGAVLMILFQNRGYDYPGVLIYVMALYTFYATVHAIVDIVQYRALGSPIMSTAKIVSLCAALVSMLNLETAMFHQFGADMAEKDQRIMIAATGAGISAVVVTLSLLLIVRATKEIRRTKMENKDSFSYTYSAAQRQEVENIRKKYLPKEEDKMQQLRALHNSATQKATGWAIALGVIGALVMGAGMSLIMSDFGSALGAYAMVVGIIAGVAGMVLIALAYPVYNHVLKHERKRIAPEILRLTDELMK